MLPEWHFFLFDPISSFLFAVAHAGQCQRERGMSQYSFYINNTFAWKAISNHPLATHLTATVHSKTIATLSCSCEIGITTFINCVFSSVTRGSSRLTLFTIIYILHGCALLCELFTCVWLYDCCKLKKGGCPYVQV